MELIVCGMDKRRRKEVEELSVKVMIIEQALTSSISQMCISSTVLCFATSLSTPPSPPPTTSTLRDGEEGGRGKGRRGKEEERKRI